MRSYKVSSIHNMFQRGACGKAYAKTCRGLEQCEDSCIVGLGFT